MDPLESFRSEAVRLIKEAAAPVDIDVELETPPFETADLAFPCFSLAKKMRKAPAVIAEEMVAKMPPSPHIRKIWAANGYINMRLDEKMLGDLTLSAVLNEKDTYGNAPSKGVRMLVEHTSVNPTGPIHVGRARNPLIGDTLARALGRCGYDVTTEYLVNDVGKQVVLLTWGVRNLGPGAEDVSEWDKADHRLVGNYKKANQLMETDPKVGEEIASMLVRFEKGDPQIVSSVKEVAERMLEGIRQSLATMNVFIDHYAWESDFILNGSAHAVVNRLKASPYCHEENGAYYLEMAEFGVVGKNTKFFFTRADGTTLYTTRDLAYHLDKFSRSDAQINVLGEDQKLGQQHLAIAMKMMGETKAPECVFYAFVSLPEGRMSTRKGVVVYLDDLIEEAIVRAEQEVELRRPEISTEKKKEIARVIGSGAIRFNIIRVQPEKQLIFKWEEALNFDGNSAPFVQYAHARACSILRKANAEAPRAAAPVDALALADGERKLIRVLAQFPTVVKDAGEKRRIHVLPAYGHELAAAFNQFYAACPVLGSGEREATRLDLVQATRWTLRNVLDTIGITAPEEM
ncbi:MAG: arginine--tRNA ligase [Methanomassiliicoccales archaeon]